ncbi:MAG: TolC family protein, partial [Verrucomicrobiae bacterium]|nr:TolC family protein [Verrucomicrobiae bacterium]
RLLALEQQRSLRERQAALAKELADFAKERSAKGELSPLDAAQALVDAQQALLGGRTLETERVTVTGALKQLLGMSAETPLTVSGTLPDLEVPVGTNFDRRPDLQGARLKEEAAKTGVDLARTRKWDDLDAGLFAAREREGRPDGERDHSGYVGVRFSLPLPFWNQNEGEVAEKTAGVERAALETEALASAIANEAAAARDEMEAHLSLAGEMKETLLPAVREQADRLKTAYERGETDLLSVLRSREQQLRLEAASLDAERDFHLARIRYEAALGVHAPAASPSGK